MHDLLLGIPGLGPEGLRKLAEFWAHGGAKAGVPPPETSHLDCPECYLKELSASRAACGPNAPSPGLAP